MPFPDYELSFAGIPFVGDSARVVRMSFDPGTPDDPGPAAPRKHQPVVSLVDEVNRLIPLSDFRDSVPQADYGGRNIGALSSLPRQADHTTSEVRVGEWYYPVTASQWSVFRGLVTSQMAKAMLAATGATTAGTFTMKSFPAAPGTTDRDYEVTTSMYLLPPRPLAELGGGLDGLFLVTLVDERYYWAQKPASLRPRPGVTWVELIQELADLLSITVTFNPAVEVAAGGPQPDSQLWTCNESASRLLDALAYNVGCAVVRKLNGTYVIMDPLVSRTTALASRGNAGRVVRTAGGDMFYSGSQLPTGSLIASRNAITPAVIDVSFPKYVQGDDPVPHFLNPRNAPPTPSVWFSDSYGDTHTVSVPTTSGGATVSGLTGTGRVSLRTTAKALYETETAAQSGGEPLNASGLSALAFFLAKDRYDSQAAIALDEIYPGTFVWEPEGIHDIIWRYSENCRQATTRVARSEWNSSPSDMQNVGVPLSGSSTSPRGVGGPLIALTTRDQLFSGAMQELTADYLSGATGALELITTAGLPGPGGRWRGRIGNEIFYLETSTDADLVNVIYRGIDGTLEEDHTAGDELEHLLPNVQYGVNLLTAGGALTVRPGAWTSGGITESVLDVRQGGIGPGYIASGAITSGMIASGGFAILSGMLNSGNLSVINWSLNFYSGYVMFPPTYINTLVLFSGRLSLSGVYQIDDWPKVAFALDQDILIQGFTGGVEGRVLFLWNKGVGKVTLRDSAPGGNGIIVPNPLTQVATSGYTSGYVLWPRDGVMLEYSSGYWHFDNPTVGAGDHGSTGFATFGPPVTYAIRHLRFGSGLGYQDNGDGSANVYNLHASGGGGSSGSAAFAGARVYRNTSQTISTGTPTEIGFTNERYDVGGFWSSGSSQSLIAPGPGYYHMGAGVEWIGSEGGTLRLTEIRLNGTTVIAATSDQFKSGQGNVNAFRQNLSCDYALLSGDFVRVRVTQDLPATGMDTLDILTDPNISPEFWIHKIGE